MLLVELCVVVDGVYVLSVFAVQANFKDLAFTRVLYKLYGQLT